MPMLEPMHTQQSIAEYGGNTPERVTADVAGHDAVEIFQRLKDDVMRAAIAQFRRLAGRARRFGRKVVRQNAPHAVHVQFAEAEHLRFAFHRQARRHGWHPPDTDRLPR